jgi:hypothetical protein
MYKVTVNNYPNSIKKLNSLQHNNWWHYKCYRADGSLKWEEKIRNRVVDEGLYHSLDVIFMSGTAYGSWYVALFNSDSTPAAGWDYAGIGTDQTEFTSYDETTRPNWNPSSIVTLALSDEVTFTASTGANTTLYGSYVVNVSTKGDNASGTGIMWCATRFNTPRAFVATEVLNVTYAINSEDV